MITKKVNIAPVMSKRDDDFRSGAVVYQILVDRFHPSQFIEQKKDLYTYPKQLHPWNELPRPGRFLDDVRYWSHELDYWGGDLQGVISQLDYIQKLQVDVVYLNPIFDSLSNHKYDATDYLKISPEYGTMKDLQELAHRLHAQDRYLMLDGVFNHVGVQNSLFQAAQDASSAYRSWFDFDERYPEGVRLWADAKSLPELNLEHDAVKDYIYRSPNSVIRSYLRAGIDGWRLDVAFDIGYQFLRELTDCAHLEKPGSMIVGETWNYPRQWLVAMDGVMNFTMRELIFHAVQGTLPPNRINTLLQRLVEDADYDALLRSWIMLDNHDTVRLSHRLPMFADQQLAQVLQFTLPGSPNLYYGSEVGMTGASDPENRAPMRWDLVHDNNAVLHWTKQLIALHQSERALKKGEYLPIEAHHLIAYERYTDRVDETVIVVINPTQEAMKEHLLIPDSSLMNFSKFDVLLGTTVPMTLIAGFLEIELPAKSFVVLKPITIATKSYTPYKRV